MALPPRMFWTLGEAAARWNCLPNDLAEWASHDHLEIVIGTGPIQAGEHELGGFVAIPAADIIAMFRRSGVAPHTGLIRRVRAPGSKTWLRLTNPPEGIEITTADLLILATEAERFEESCNLRPKANGGAIAAPAGGGSIKWDWDQFYQKLFKRIHDGGLPKHQQDLVFEMRDWFEANSPNGEGPDESTIRRKIAPIWRQISG